MIRIDLNVLLYLTIFLGLLSFNSCKKINEATELGADLIPAVDNINTFERALNTLTDNRLLNDSAELFLSDFIAIGNLNDPEFGNTTASGFFNISRTAFGFYPFIATKPDSVSIDSVVLSLGYAGFYGDTNSTQTVRVFEIDPTSNFNDTTLYKFSTSPSNFKTVGSQLGSKTFKVSDLNDSMTIFRKRDTSKVINVLRIPLTKTLGDRFKLYDTLTAFKNDSAFKTFFKGFALKVENGNTLTYINLQDQAKSKLIIYFRAIRNGITDTSSAEFFHLAGVPPVLRRSPANFRNGQANTIERKPAGNYLAALNSISIEDQTLFIQSTPGSYAAIKIPSLDTFTNKIINRAELIATRLPSTGDNIFLPPPILFIDKINAANDSAFVFQNDILDNAGNLDYNRFGGRLRSDGTYRFIITRYIQDIVTNRSANQNIRLYAPVRATLNIPRSNQNTLIEVNDLVANGRVVIAGGNHPDPALRLRLRIVYTRIQ